MGKPISFILWDFKKLFDYIDIGVLIEEAEATNFPLEELS